MVDWVKDQFANNMLFRRFYIVFMGGYIWMATHYSFSYLFIATEKGVTSIDIVANLAAIMAFPTVVMKGIYDKYSAQRSGE
jgi:hypothetical protein